MTLPDQDLKDIQGLVHFAYYEHPFAAYVLLKFGDDPAVIRNWLQQLLADPKTIDAADDGKPDIGMNIAFTFPGLRALGLASDVLSGFSTEFREGMDDGVHRSRILGDIGEYAPEHWDWGYQSSDGRSVDALLLIFAKCRPGRENTIAEWTRHQAIKKPPRVLRGELFGTEQREAFGFVDGISQPKLKGMPDSSRARQRQPPMHHVEDGEFLLGRPDGTGVPSRSPQVSKQRDPIALLARPGLDRNRDTFDLGYNGTYLVFRQLSQDVAEFERMCSVQSQKLGIAVDTFKALLLGRWADGSRFVGDRTQPRTPTGNCPAENGFGFRGSDLHGEICPIGSHVRRANPRDALGENGEEGLAIANRHRILRRGRPYGLLEAAICPERDVGLHFICLNADIARQFEFVQQNWINSPAFGGLVGEDDPVVGARHGDAHSGVMTIPHPEPRAVRQRVTGLPRFITVKGGAYFFLPSKTALKYFAS